MKSKYLTALLPVLSMTALVHADQASNAGDKSAKHANEPQFMQYHNRIAVFTPWHQTYERIKPDAFYIGVEGYAAAILNHRQHKHHHNNWFRNVLVDGELRLGYNYFWNGRDHATPFIGGGYVQDFTRRRHHHHHHHTKHKPGIAYGTLGFLYDHEFNSIFNLGLNAKLLMGGPVNKKHFDWGGFVVGVDVAIPITFRFGHKRHWDLRIEPFNLYLHGSKHSQDYWGFRNTIGYRF